MTLSHSLWAAAAAVVTVNLPFGFWRAGTRKFSCKWFVAVHAPVPLVVAIRLLLGIGWRLANLPALVGAFFVGQVVGGRIRTMWHRFLPNASDEAPDPAGPQSLDVRSHESSA
jgi:hypothetical protein